MTPAFAALVDAAAASIRAVSSAKPLFGIILGSGMSRLAQRFGGQALPFGAIAGFPKPAVAGPAGRLYLSAKTAVMAGRFHYYEGHTWDTVLLPTAVLQALGVKVLIITNAAGSLRPDFRPGSLVLIKDHINLMGDNPLVGPHQPRFGPRFPSLSEVYSPRLQKAAAKLLPLHQGVYLAVTGPSYATPAETAAFRVLGADLVGMSTVPEAILARSLGLEVLGISLVANLANSFAGASNRTDVTATAQAASAILGAVLESVVEQVAE